jgi:hypothetical protein
VEEPFSTESRQRDISETVGDRLSVVRGADTGQRRQNVASRMRDQRRAVIRQFGETNFQQKTFTQWLSAGFAGMF